MAIRLRDRKTREIVLQSAFVAIVGAVIVTAILVTRSNLATQNMSMSWDFLHYSTGSTIYFSLIAYDVSSTYARALLVGFLNTLLLGGISVSLAVLLGSVIGIARLADNKLVRWSAAWFVQLFRNIPLILQLFFWYNLITHLPPPRGAISVLGVAFLSNRGMVLPSLNVQLPFIGLAVVILLAGVLAARPLSQRIGGRFGAIWGLLVAAAAVLAVHLGRDAGSASLFSLPQVQGLRFAGGVTIIPELTAAIVAIALFGAAYVAEIVRSGFLAIPRGQIEAAQALALTKWQTLTRVRLPLMIRIVLPTMTNQIIWLMKATTIGLAVGFADFFGVIANAINNSGQTLTLIFILILGFWAINLTIAAVMNLVNRAIAIPGHRS